MLPPSVRGLFCIFLKAAEIRICLFWAEKGFAFLIFLFLPRKYKIQDIEKQEYFGKIRPLCEMMVDRRFF